MIHPLQYGWRCLFILALGAGVGQAGPVPEIHTVFEAARDGYASIRIPALVVARAGTVLAFAEGRAANQDQAANDIILKRSPDGGRTWLPLQVVADAGAASLNNPTAVVEQKSGRIFLMYQYIPAHLKEHDAQIVTGYSGTNVYRSLVTWSDDAGKTWSPPEDITPSVKRPTGATTIASGPGIGIQLTRGAHRGRLLIPFNEGPFYQWNNYAVYSDDGGEHWQWGENVPGALVQDAQGRRRSQINEVQMVELSDGAVRLNSRQFAGNKLRKTAVSHDGGQTWSPVTDVPELRDPSCNASVLRYSFDDAQGRGRLLFSGPDSDQRRNGTLYLSYDDGATWPVKRTLVPEGFAYSVLTRLPDGQIGCLFEPNDARRLRLARIPLTWLEPAGPHPTPRPPSPPPVAPR
ncbi:MAG TPA: sialidase family protein [Verrucomicrobiota bacterium]|nr:sialidase family protein [Verrucomicrobiota bacterium]HNT15404.1 sialidase family protein [Verrucomicrobiota bacterium]